MYIPALAAGSAATGSAGILAGAAPDADPAAHGHYWCNCTQAEAGPDDKHVGPQNCCAGRACFEE